MPHGARYCFHAYKSVAPLKLKLSTHFGASRRMFPRLQKRGPIEASKSAATARVFASFHAYKSVAPLKLVRPRELDPAVPRFHAYKSVAPLKLERLLRLAEHERGFHAYKSVAPLKLPRRRTRQRKPPAVSTLTKAWPHRSRFISAFAVNLDLFPRLQKRGPIEATPSPPCLAIPPAVSTLTKAWPH